MQRATLRLLRLTILLLMLPQSCGQWSWSGEPSSAEEATATPAGPRGVASYKAVSGVSAASIPTRVYLFPPLLSNARGLPIEKLMPVYDAGGELIEWKAPGAGSEQLREEIARRVRERGFTVIGFMDLIETEAAYSTLVVSSFYTREANLEGVAEGGFDRSLSVMISGSVFDADLDPKTKKDLLRVDGSINYSSKRPIPTPLRRAFSETAQWFGDSVGGSTLID